MSKNGMTIDTSNFNRMIRELSRLSGVDVKKVLEAEVAGVLVQSRKKTIQASAKAIRVYYTSETTASGRRRFITFNSKIYCLTNHFGDNLWNQIVAFRRGQMKTALERRGLSRAGWSRIGRMIDIPNSYLPETKKSFEKNLSNFVSGTRSLMGGKMVISINYGLRAGIQGAGADRAFENAINGRVKFFAMNLRKDVFKKVSTIAKKYPGIQVRGI